MSAEKVKIISMIVILLAIIVGTICATIRKADTHKIVCAAMAISLSFVLSLLKVSPVTYGGSITLCSMLPVILIAYFCGIGYGLFAGLIFGLLNFISDPYILTYASFFLDYVLAYCSVGVAGLFKRFIKNVYANLTLGILLVYLLRFMFHLISGIIYFNEGAIWTNLPKTNAFVYSALYQLVYIPGDCAITLIIALVLAKTKVLNTLEQRILK